MNASLHLPILIVLTGLFASFLIPGIYIWKKKIAEILSLTTLGIMFLMGLYLTYLLTIDGPFTYAVGTWPAPFGIEFSVDHLGVYMSLIITGVGFLCLLYASQDLRHELSDNALSLYYPLYLLLMSSMVGMALTNDLFNLYVLLEITLLSSVSIICVKENKDTVEASLKYLILNALGSAAILMGIAMLYMITGHLNLTYLGQEIANVYPMYSNLILATMALFLVGFGVKAAMFPMHVWLPDAHGSAPSPSSAVLSGLVIKIYVIGLIRVYFNVYPSEILETIPIMDVILWFSAVGMLIGSMFAIVQEDIKKLLAYSSVAQICYVFLGISLLTITGMQGGLLHILNHAIMKSMLFLAAGAIIYTTGWRKISDLQGVGLKLPLTMSCFTIGAISMIGIPGTSGFISKWYLALGALEANRPFFVVIILASSLLNGVYYLPIVVNSFFGEAKEQARHITIIALPWQMKLPLLVLSAGVIFFGFFPSIPLNFIEQAAALLLE